MATSQIASMLDELMGRNRNYAPDDAKARELKWTDSDVCKYYIVQFCPHDLFTNTKADLGACGKIHDDALKAKFQEEDERESYKKGQFIDDFLRFCQRMLSDLSSRIKRAKERLALTQEKEERFREQMAQQAAEGSGNKEADEKILLLSEKITALVAEAETAGCNGNVEQAQGLLKLSDQLREEREDIRKSLNLPSQNMSGSHPLREEYAAQQKAMEVCDTCGAFLIVGDAQQRIDDHLLGKQHVGYARLRAAVDRILDERRKFREEREKEIDGRRKKREDDSRKDVDDRRRNRDREKESNHRESRDRDKESGARRERDSRRERDRDRNRYTRERSRDREISKRSSRDDRGRDRSRSRERERRDRRRSRDRDYERDKGSSRKRSRERRRSRSKERRRSRSKERRSRSRNRSRDRSKRDKSKERYGKDANDSKERQRSSRSSSRSKDKKEGPNSSNRNSLQNRSRSNSRSKESNDYKTISHSTDIKKDCEKYDSEKDYRDRSQSPNPKDPKFGVKRENGSSP